MSYVRAKDKIIDVTGKNIVNSYYDMKPDDICITCEYREADNIEELFDVCIGVEKPGRNDFINVVVFEIEERDDGEKTVYIDDERWDIPLKKFLENFECYGAILTKKGIIYAAKMNEKEDWNCYE